MLPGNSPGELTVDGDLTLTDTSITVIEIAGTTPGIATGYDVINVTGILTLGGTLQIELLDGFIPDVADVFNFFNAPTTLAQFDDFIFPVFEGNTLAFDGTGQLIVSAVPVPPAIWLFISALALVARGRRIRS